MGTAKGMRAMVRAVPMSFARIDWRGWDEEQNRAFAQTWIDRSRAANVPVPRRANCHFFGIDSDPRNVYFY